MLSTSTSSERQMSCILICTILHYMVVDSTDFYIDQTTSIKSKRPNGTIRLINSGNYLMIDLSQSPSK